MQATSLGAWLATEEPLITRVFVSPRRRTRQTLANLEAQHAGLPPAEARPGLREIELTVWEGQYRSDLRDAEGRPDLER